MGSPDLPPSGFSPRHRVIFRCGQAAPGASEVNQGSSPGTARRGGGVLAHQRPKKTIGVNDS